MTRLGAAVLANLPATVQAVAVKPCFLKEGARGYVEYGPDDPYPEPCDVTWYGLPVQASLSCLIRR